MRSFAFALSSIAAVVALAKPAPCPFADLLTPRIPQSPKEIDREIAAAAQAVRLTEDLVPLELARPGGKGKSLPASFAGLCGFASASVLHQLHAVGIDGIPHQTSTLFGGGLQHTVVFVPIADPVTGLPSKTKGLWVDLTMKQFNERWISGGRRKTPPDFTVVTQMAKDPEAKGLLSAIFRDGYVEVDDHKLQLLGRCFKMDAATGKFPPADPKLRVETLFAPTSDNLYTPYPDPQMHYEYSADDFPMN